MKLQDNARKQTLSFTNNFSLFKNLHFVHFRKYQLINYKNILDFVNNLEKINKHTYCTHKLLNCEIKEYLLFISIY